MLYRVFESDNVKVKDPIYFSTSFDNLEEALQWFNDLTDTYIYGQCFENRSMHWFGLFKRKPRYCLKRRNIVSKRYTLCRS